MRQSNRDIFFLQLADIAPAIGKLLKMYPSRIRAHVTTGDAQGGYGISITFQVFVDVLTHLCEECGETQFTRPKLDRCHNHHFKHVWQELASGEGSETQEALVQADGRIAKWLNNQR